MNFGGGQSRTCSASSRVGDHRCAIVDNEQEYETLFVNFVLDGLLSHEKIIYLCDEHRIEDLKNMLDCSPDFQKKIGKSADAIMNTGQLVIANAAGNVPISPEDTNIKPERFIENFTLMTKQAIEEENYSRLRVAAEMTWAFKQKHVCGQDMHSIIHLEVCLSKFYDNNLCTGLCIYNSKDFTSDTLLSVLDTHPVACINSQTFDNFYYMPPTEYLVPDLSASMLHNRVRNLNQKKEMETKLRMHTAQVEALNKQLVEESREREKAEVAKQIAEQLNKAKSEFLAVMSHEIRTPLNGVIAASSFMNETPLLPEQKEYMDIIKVSSEHLMTVLNDILDWSKIESGKLSLEQSDFLLHTCVKGLVDMFRGSEKEVDLQYHIDQDVPNMIVGDITRLRQILFNLVSNAVKFTPSGGRVNIRVHKNVPRETITGNLHSSAPTGRRNSMLGILSSSSKGIFGSASGHLDPPPTENNEVELVFEVSDTGIGIPKDKWNLIFSSFSQVDSSTTRVYGGTGLGLTICKNLVEMMKGRIWLDSTVNQGSTFYFTIKTKMSTEKPPSHSEMSEANSRKRSLETNNVPLSILVAEDNPTNQLVVSKMLNKLGCSFVMVDNGQKAVYEAENNPYDIVFMDVQMPVMDGLEASRRISAFDWRGKHRPRLVAMTASALEEDKSACYKAGMEFHISKPLKLETIKQVLDKITQEKIKRERTV